MAPAATPFRDAGAAQRNVARLRALEQGLRDGTPPAAAQPAAPAAGSVPAVSIDRRARPARPVPPPTQPVNPLWPARGATG